MKSLTLSNLLMSGTPNRGCTPDNGPTMDRQRTDNGPMTLRHFAVVLCLLMLTICVGSVWATEYTYTSFTTSFVKGTTNGTDINDGLPGSLSTLASSGSSNYASFSGTYSYYKSTGAGIRISKKDNAGNITFTLSNALKDSAIYALVIYASKVDGNSKAKLDITPTGPAVNGYTTVTNITNGTLPAYNASSYPATTQLGHYKLDTIKVNGKKIETLNFASAAKGYTMLHAITIVTQTEKASGPSCTDAPTVTAPSNSSFLLTTKICTEKSEKCENLIIPFTLHLRTTLSWSGPTKVLPESYS